MPLRAITLRLIVIVKLPLRDKPALSHSLAQRSLRVAICPSSAGDLPRVVEQDLGFGLACPLWRDGWRWAGLGWLDGILDFVFVGHAAAVLPVHWVVVAGEAAAITV
jgi:hypothetical protein